MGTYSLLSTLLYTNYSIHTTPTYYSHPLFLPTTPYILYSLPTDLYPVVSTQKIFTEVSSKKNTAEFGKEMLCYFCLYYLNFFLLFVLFKSIYIYFLFNLRRFFFNLLTEFTLLIKYVNYGLFSAHKYDPVNFYRFRP